MGEFQARANKLLVLAESLCEDAEQLGRYATTPEGQRLVERALEALEDATMYVIRAKQSEER